MTRRGRGYPSAAMGWLGPSISKSPVSVSSSATCGPQENETGRVCISGGRKGSPGLRPPDGAFTPGKRLLPAPFHLPPSRRSASTRTVLRRSGPRSRLGSCFD
jgi:hypothetical protein